MAHQQRIGRVHPQVDGFPEARAQVGVPEVMAGGGQQEQQQQGRHAQGLERKPAERVVARVRNQQRHPRVQSTETVVPERDQHAVHQRDEKGGHTQVTPVVQKRFEARRQPRQRPDAQQKAQLQKGQTAGGPNQHLQRREALIRRQQHAAAQRKRPQIDGDAGQHPRIESLLEGRPVDSAVAVRHQRLTAGGALSSAGGSEDGSGNGSTALSAGVPRTQMADSKIAAKPGTSPHQIRRCQRRCPRFMTRRATAGGATPSKAKAATAQRHRAR